jgi:two-component system NtrC family sensor kinase
VFRREGELYRLAASHGFTPEYSEFMAGQTIEPGQGTLIGRTALYGRTVHIPDAAADPEYIQSGQKRGGFRSMLGVPLLREGAPIAVIALTKKSRNRFLRSKSSWLVPLPTRH